MEKIDAMKKIALTICASLVLLCAGLSPASANHKRVQKKYHAEHGARMYRHHQLTPTQRHARMVKYGREHQARQHRHRAHMNAVRHRRG